MNKLTNIMTTILIVCGLIIGNTVWAYSLKDFKGPYGYAMDGVVTITDPSSGTQMSIPISGAGRFVASGKDTDGDGLGEVTFFGYWNVGGFAILTQATAAEKPGTYSIDSATGTGSASIVANIVGPPELPLGALPAGINASDFAAAFFEFRFVVGMANGEIDLIGTSLSAAEQGVKTTPIGAIVTRGRAWPQM